MRCILHTTFSVFCPVAQISFCAPSYSTDFVLLRGEALYLFVAMFDEWINESWLWQSDTTLYKCNKFFSQSCLIFLVHKAV